MEESRDDEDEKLIDTSSVLPYSSPSATWEDEQDPLSLSGVQEEEGNSHIKAAPVRVLRSQTLRGGSRRRKGSRLIGKESESELQLRFKSSSSSKPKQLIKIIIPATQDECVKEESIVKNEDDCSHHESSIKEEGKSTKAGGSSPQKGKTSNRRKTDQPHQRLKRLNAIVERTRQKRAMESPAEKKARNQRANVLRKKQRATESPAEKEVRLQKARLLKQKRKARLTEEERMKERLAEAERKRIRRQKEKRYTGDPEYRQSMKTKQKQNQRADEMVKGCLTREEAEQAEFQLKMKKYLARVAWKAKFTKEEWKEKKKWNQQMSYMRFAALPPEEREKKLAERRAYHRSLPAEKKRQYYRRAGEKYRKKLMEENPRKLEEFAEKLKNYQREKTATETPEERWKRLLRYKVYQAKRNAKIQIEKEGVLTKEEMERRLEEVVKQVEEKDRLEREKKPVDPAEYKPRESARKPKKKATKESEDELTIRQMVPCPFPSSLQQNPNPSPSCSIATQVEGCIGVGTKTELLSPHLESIRGEESTCAHDEPDDNDDYYDDGNYESEAEHIECKEEAASTATPSPSPPFPSNLCKTEEDELEQPLTCDFFKREISSTVAPEAPVDTIPHCIQEAKKVEVEESVVCEDCGKCLYPQSMKTHKHLVHNPSNVLTNKCPKCDKEFATSHSLWDHYLNLHSEEKRVPPSTSSKSPEDGTQLESPRLVSPTSSQQADKQCAANIEIRKKSESGLFICGQCGKKYTTKAVCEAHVKKVHLGERIICEVCGKEEQTQSKLWRHKISKHPELDTPPPEGMIICRYCSEPVFRSLPQHLQKFHPDKCHEFVKTTSISERNRGTKIKCPECHAAIRKDSMKRHMRNVHGRGSKAFPCQQCGKEFKETYRLNEHIRLMHSIEGFDRKVDAMKLIKEKKDEDGKTLFFCSLCDEKLFWRKDIGGHLLSAHLEVFEELNKGNADGDSSLWKCVECSERHWFDSEQLFYSHVKSCHPETTNYCSQLNCYKLFPTRHSLRIHHDKEHPHAKFTGPLCYENSSYRFPRLNCSFCNALFRRKHELAEHVKSLHADSYFDCPHCQLAWYTEEQQLNKHVAICRQNSDAQLVKKNGRKGRRVRRKKIQETIYETDESASESESCLNQKKTLVITEPSLSNGTRCSSGIQSKTKKRFRVNVGLESATLDEKLRKEVKVMVKRLTKQQLEYYALE